MYERGHDNSYRAAFLAASTELNEVFREVQRLRIRKDQVEKAIEAVKPLLDTQAPSYERELVQAPLSSEPAQYATEFAPAPVPAPVAAPAAPRIESPAPGDSIQRRIDSILGLAVA
jgi:hypothetical protein